MDTSGLYALADHRDKFHEAARRALNRSQARGEEFLIHTYVQAEAFAFLQNRLGLEAAVEVSRETRAFRAVVVDRPLHDEAVQWLLDREGSAPSLVDAVSFLVMRREGIEAAFAFDADFVRAGFRLYPEE